MYRGTAQLCVQYIIHTVWVGWCIFKGIKCTLYIAVCILFVIMHVVRLSEQITYIPKSHLVCSFR